MEKEKAAIPLKDCLDAILTAVRSGKRAPEPETNSMLLYMEDGLGDYLQKNYQNVDIPHLTGEVAKLAWDPLTWSRQQATVDFLQALRERVGEIPISYN